MAKGQDFERSFCVALSSWWTRGERTDVFWRTSNSGGRATVRGQKGEKTRGQYGDVCATDPIGDVFTRTILVELKRGYGKSTIADLLDRPPGAKLQDFEQWIGKLEKHKKDAEVLAWMLVVRRDRRIAVVYMPLTFLDALVDVGAFRYKIDEVHPYIMLRARVSGQSVEVMGIHLDDFLAGVSPDHIYLLTNHGTQELRNNNRSVG